jgi:hypothetical protein
MNSRRKYKSLFKEKKRLHDKEQERWIIEVSENNRFQALTKWQPRFPRDIQIQTWENHFSKLLNKRQTGIGATKASTQPVLQPFHGE